MTDLRERIARSVAGIVCKGIEIDASWPQYLPEADAILAELAPELAPQQQAEPVGEWVMVPREPTEAMRATFIAQAGSATHFTHTLLQCADFDSRYRAMLAAAPQPQPQASAWQEGYRAGVNDERISEASIGVAGFDAKVEPNRNNPYAAPQHGVEPQASAEDLDTLDFAREASRLLYGFMLDVNAIGPHGAGENLVRGIKESQRIRARLEQAPPAAVPAGYALVSEMLAAAEDGIDSAMTDMGFGGMDVDLTIQRVKRLMLAAASKENNNG